MAELRILTFMTDPDLYAQMRESFEAGGFQEPAVVYQVVDNTRGNHADPYSMLNDLLAEIAEPLLIVCHQDIRLGPGADLAVLRGEIARVDETYPDWGVLGPAGRGMDDVQVSCVSDPWQAPPWTGPWPVEAQVLDEVFLVIRPGRAELSSGLSGFHLYGADLCLSARRRGGRAAAICFPLVHLSNGLEGWRSASYRQARDALQIRLSPHYRFRLLVTMFGDSLVLCRHPTLRRLTDHRRVATMARRWLGRSIIA